VGQKGFTQSLVDAIDDALGQHELVKVKFVEFKEKERKRALAEQIEKAVACEMVGMVGHIATFFRRQSDPQKRKIKFPTHDGG
jgi:RNA-binding protein